MMEKKWRAIYVRSRSEKKVAAMLSDEAFEAYVPLVKTLRQWSDRKKKVELPLIYGYVFVRALPVEFERILGIAGVVRFVRSEGKIAVIKSHEIERLKQLVELGYQMEARPIQHTFRKGDKVKITSGALTGMEAFVTGKGRNREIELLLESIGHSVIVKLPRAILMPMIANEKTKNLRLVN